jgi:hypothetical protein
MVECSFDLPLRQWMQAHKVAVLQSRRHLVQLNAVPAGPGFSKPRTNVLLRRRPGDDAWDAFVDDDLAYSGDDPGHGALFAGPRQRHWLSLTPAEPLHGDVNAVIRQVLTWLESPREMDSPANAPAEPAPALEPYARTITAAELANLPRAAPWQTEAVLRTAETVTRGRPPRCAMLWGPAGCGKTVVARCAAAKLVRHARLTRVLEVRAASLCAGAMIWPERDDRLRLVVEAVLGQTGTLVLLEQADLALVKSEIAQGVLADALDAGLNLIAVARPEFTPQWLPPGSTLERRLELVPVPAPDTAEMGVLLNQVLREHPMTRARQIAPEVVAAVLTLAGRRPGANPGAALGLLEAVLNQAAWNARPRVGPDDVFHLVTDPEP